jgi:2-polyprenyl-3-methyl-5-hydroxy-6-metoxy-1,4-benzoquinol methylase
MSQSRLTLRPEYFEELYAVDPDPWKFAASSYERDKYALTLEAMPKLRYHSALEVGCSIGVLTRSLASRCEALVAIDAAQAPLVAAKRRCADLSSVHFEHMFVPEQWPVGDFDLILLSEVVYYLSREDVGRLAVRVTNSLAKGGSVILVHWTGPTNYPLSGDEAAALFIERLGQGFDVDRADRYEKFRLDVLLGA